MASENGSEAEGTQESDNDTENDIQETESSSLHGLWISAINRADSRI